MMKHNIPTIKIARFLSENIVTGLGVNNDYIEEVEKLIKMSPKACKASVESITELLRFKEQ